MADEIIPISEHLKRAVREQNRERELVPDRLPDSFADELFYTGSAAESTLEALLYELRGGVRILQEEGARGRLRSCDERSLRWIIQQLRAWKIKKLSWLPPWSESDIAELVKEHKCLKNSPSSKTS